MAVVFLLYTNAAGVAVRSHGAPPIIGLVVILALGGPVLMHMWRGHHRRIVFAPVLLWLLLFLIVQLLSTISSRYPSDAVSEVQQYMIEGLLLFFLVTNAIHTSAALRNVLWTVVAAGAFLGLISVVQWLTGSFFRPYGGFGLVPIEYLSGFAQSPRAAGPLGDPNYYAQVLLVPLALAMTMLWSERSRGVRVLAFGAAGLCVAGILLTFSRGAGLAFVVIFVAMVLLRAVRLRYVVVVVVGLAVALAAVPAYRDRISTVSSVGGATAEAGTEQAADESIRARMTEMLAAAHVFADHPLTGVGPAVFPRYYQEYAQRVGIEVHEETKWGKNAGQAPERQAHNIFLSKAAETGIAGLMVFIAAIGTTLIGLLRTRRRCLLTRPELASMATALFLAILAYTTAGIFLSLAYERYFWLLLALGAVPPLILESEGRTDRSRLKERSP
jgi:O-antigen ligase